MYGRKRDAHQDPREMRHWQKRYFSERRKADPATRDAILKEAKKAEAKLNSYVFNFQLLVESKK